MGLVVYHPYLGAELADTGREPAGEVLRKHMLLECFFHEVLGMDIDSPYEEASRMKHELFTETEDALRRYLRNPSRCPPGIPIP
nr:iron dependent repressor, metal binding and dimerization domain protein [Methanothermobacter sp. K4]